MRARRCDALGVICAWWFAQIFHVQLLRCGLVVAATSSHWAGLPRCSSARDLERRSPPPSRRLSASPGSVADLALPWLDGPHAQAIVNHLTFTHPLLASIVSCSIVFIMGSRGLMYYITILTRNVFYDFARDLPMVLRCAHRDWRSWMCRCEFQKLEAGA